MNLRLAYNVGNIFKSCTIGGLWKRNKLLGASQLLVQLVTMATGVHRPRYEYFKQVHMGLVTMKPLRNT
jgi:hypothetical protein